MKANQILNKRVWVREKQEGRNLFNSELRTRNHFIENVFS